MRTPHCLINGQFADTVSAHDRGLHYGDGIFETLRVLAGTMQFWQPHINRMLRGCERLGMEMIDVEILRSECMQIITKGAHGVLKIIITRGVGQRGYNPPSHRQHTRLIFWYPDNVSQSAAEPDAVRLTFCKTPLAMNPALAGIKHLNRLEHILARQEWTDPDIFDGIMCDVEGNVIECTASNLFLRVGNDLLTPDLSQCGVEGIVRQWILELAEELQNQHAINLRVATVTRTMMNNADEIFITNSVAGVVPVCNINQQVFKSGKITGLLVQKFTQLTHTC